MPSPAFLAVIVSSLLALNFSTCASAAAPVAVAPDKVKYARPTYNPNEPLAKTFSRSSSGNAAMR